MLSIVVARPKLVRAAPCTGDPGLEHQEMLGLRRPGHTPENGADGGLLCTWPTPTASAAPRRRATSASIGSGCLSPAARPLGRWVGY